MNDGVRKVEDITAREAAVLLMATIENEGSTFQLADGNNFNCDLDTVRDLRAKTR